MTRPKTRPPIRKPVFDEENTLRFAAEEVGHADTAQRNSGRVTDKRKPTEKSETGRVRVALMLKGEIVARLEEEAARKDKSVDQIVEKLAIKHFGKH